MSDRIASEPNRPRSRPIFTLPQLASPKVRKFCRMFRLELPSDPLLLSPRPNVRRVGYTPIVTPTSMFAWRDLAENTSALGSRPDSIEVVLCLEPAGWLQARPPAIVGTLCVAQSLYVAKPLTLPEKSTSHSPALKPIPALAVDAPAKARAPATAMLSFLCFSIRKPPSCVSQTKPADRRGHGRTPSVNVSTK